MYNNPLNAYNKLPLLAGLNLPSTELHDKLILAREALARLDTAAKFSPFAPTLVHSIPIVEAEASSAIENIVTTQDELFTANFESGSLGSKRPIDFIGRYFTAMAMARREITSRPITAELARRICVLIEGHDLTVRNSPGTALMDGSGRTVYTPPDDPRVLELLLKDWESFANDQTVDPLIRMAIGHYQFESIHPFPNGNGRTGRILNLLVLETAGLLNKPVLHLSREIKDHAQEYYDLLRYTTSSGDYVPWTRYMLDRVIAASNIGLLQLEMLSDYMEELHKVTHPAFKNGIPYSYLNQIATVPYTKTVSVMAACDASRPTATKWLHALVSLGYLQESTHNRTKYFINTRLLRILNPA